MRSASGRRWRPALPLRWLGLVLLCAASCPGAGDAPPPMAVDDSYATTQGLALNIPAPGLLANDLGTDLRCDPQTTTTAQGNKVVIAEDGGFVYMPLAAFAGRDTFAYTLLSARGSTSGTVTVNVAASAQPQPRDDSYETRRGTTLVVSAANGVLANDVANGGVLTLPSTSTVAGGTLILSPTGGFSYTPKDGFTGADSFTYQLVNAKGVGSATVSFRVVASPSAQRDAFASDGTLINVDAERGLLANDDLGFPAATLTSFGGGSLGGSLTGHLAGSTASFDSGGSVTVFGDGSLAFVPPSSFQNDVTFSYRLSSTAGTSDTTVVIGRPSAPVAAPDSYDAPAGVTLARTPPGLLANDTLGTPAGTIVSFGGGSLGGQVTDHAAGQTVTLERGSLTVRSDGAFELTSDAAATGAVTFRYRLANTQGARDALVTITLVFGAVAVDDVLTIDEGQPAELDVLANDLGVAPVRVVSFGGGTLGGQITDHPAGATVTLGTGSLTVAAGGAMELIPDDGFSGAFTFFYRLSSGNGEAEAAVIVTVGVEPLAAGDLYRGAPLTPLVVGTEAGLLSNDTVGEPEARVLSFGGGGLGGSVIDHVAGALAEIEGATLIVRPDGSFTLTPTKLVGRITFNYRIGNDLSVSDATVIVLIAAGAMAEDDLYTVTPGESVVRDPGDGDDLLDNDALGSPSATVVSFGGGDLGGDPGDHVAGSRVAPLPGYDDGSLFVDDDGSFTLIPATGQVDDFAFEYRIANVVSESEASVLVQIRAGVVITSANHATFRSGSPGTFRVRSAGVPTPSLTMTGAPAFLSLRDAGDGTATLSGLPPAGTGGLHTLTLGAANGEMSATQTFTLRVNEEPHLTSATGTVFTVGQSGSFQLAATGYPTTFTFSSGTLPAGLTVSQAGLLAGTPGDGTAGVYKVEMRATNGVAPTATQVFTLVVNEAPVFTSEASATFRVGVAGTTFQVAARGYPESFTYRVEEALPAGLSLSAAGVLAGTPGDGTAGTYALTVHVSNGIAPDGTQPFTLTIDEPITGPPSFTSDDHTTFTALQEGSFQVTGNGLGAITFTSTGAPLPAGVTLMANGQLGGTPASGTGGVHHLTFTATSGAFTATQSFTLTVDEAPALTSAATATFTLNKAGTTFQLGASGYPKTFTFSNAGEALPAGLMLSSAGLFTGTASGPVGEYNLTLSVQNGVAPAGTQSFKLLVVQAPVFSSTASASFQVGQDGTFQATAEGFPSEMTFSTASALPSGITFDADGTLAGTPAAGTGGLSTLTLKATNGVLPDATQTFSLTVKQAPRITSGDNVTFVAGNAGGFDLTADGFPETFTFSSAGSALPGGVTLSSAGHLGGTPAAGSGGVYHPTFQVQNGVGNAGTQSFTLTVNEKATFTNPVETVAWTVGVSGVTYTLTAAGQPATFTFGVAGDSPSSLPAGLSLTAATGLIAGTPDPGTSGTYNVKLTVTNGVGGTTARTFTVTVRERPVFTAGGPTVFTVGIAGSYQLAATGFPTPITFSTGDALPGGVTLGSDGLLAGTPAAGAGKVWNLSIKAQNGAGETTKAFVLTVNEGPAITSATTATFKVGAAGSFAITTTGHPAPTITATGALPSGVTLSGGVLSGTPAAATGGVYPITLKASNSVSDTTQSFTLTVTQAPAITSAASALFSKGQAGTFTVIATGYPTTMTFTETGALPAGVSLDGATGALAGTPTEGGVFPITLKAQNGVIPDATQSFTLTVGVAPVARDDGPTATSAPGDAYHVAQGGGISSGGSPNLLANDDLETPAATVTSAGWPTGDETAAGTAAATRGGGSVIVLPGGAFSYTPPSSGFVGLDAFRYRIASSSGGSTATVTVGVGVRPGPVTDAYPNQVIGNVGVNTSQGTTYSLLANDLGSGIAAVAEVVNAVNPDDPGLAVVGQVTVDAMGRFSFVPVAGYRGKARFAYQIASGFGSASAVCNLTVSGMIWFLAADNPSTGDGRLQSPFGKATALGTFIQTAADQPGDTIFVYDTSLTYAGNLTLLDGQRLVGRGAKSSLATLAGVSDPHAMLPSTGLPAPVPVEGALRIGTDNTLRGIAVVGSLRGTSFGTLTTGDDDVSLAGDGSPTLALDTGTVSGGLKSVTVAGPLATGLTFTGVGGSWRLRAGTIAPGVGGALSVLGGTLSLTVELDVTQSVNASAISVVDHSTGTLQFPSGTITATSKTDSTGAAGLLFDNADGGYSFLGTVSLNGVSNAIRIVNGSSGTFTFGPGTAITKPNAGGSGTAFFLLSSNAAVTYSGSIDLGTGTGPMIAIDNHDAGDVIFQTGNLSTRNAGAVGINVSNSNGGSVQLNGPSKTVTMTSGSSNGISLSGNTGGVISFSGGGLVVDQTGTSTAGSLVATGGGTVTVKGTGNKLLASTGTALRVVGTTIGADGLTFERIASSGGTATGIILDTTGDLAGLTVTGLPGAPTPADTGGILAGKTGEDGNDAVGIGVYLRDTRAVSLAFMSLRDFSNFAIRGSSVRGLSLSNVVVSRTTGTNGSSAALHEGAVVIDELTGAAAITASTIGGGLESNLRVVNSVGTLDRLVLSGSTVNPDLALNPVGDSVRLLATGSATLNVSVLGSVVNNGAGSALRVDAEGSAHVDAVVRGNRFTRAVSVNSADTGQVSYDVSCNRVAGATASAVSLVEGTGAGSLSGTVYNNVIPGSTSGSGVQVQTTGDGTHTALLKNNVVTSEGAGSHFAAISNGGAGTLNLTMRGNSGTMPSASILASLSLTVVSDGGANTINALIGGSGAAQNNLSESRTAEWPDVVATGDSPAKIQLGQGVSSSLDPLTVLNDNNGNGGTWPVTYAQTGNAVTVIPALTPALPASINESCSPPAP